MLASPALATTVMSVDKFELPHRPFPVHAGEINKFLRGTKFWPTYDALNKEVLLPEDWQVGYLSPLRFNIFVISELGEAETASKVISSHRLFSDRCHLIAHIALAIAEGSWPVEDKCGNADIIMRYLNDGEQQELILSRDEGRWTIMDYRFTTYSNIANGMFFISN